MDKLHRLLQRQINKYIPDDLKEDICIRGFIQSVNDAYNSYEKDFKQLERILEISSNESFKELNNIRAALDLTAAVFMIDTNGCIQFVNDNFCEIIKSKKSDILFKNYQEIFISPFETQNFHNLFIYEIKKGKVWKGEVYIKGFNGDIVCTTTSIIPLLNNDNIVYQYLFIAFDITQQKEAENELRKLSMVADQTQSGVVITNAFGEVEWVNKAFEKITEFTFEEIKGQKPGRYLQGSDTNLDTIEFIKQQINLQVPFECEILNYTKSKKPYWIKLQIQPLFDEKGKLKQYFAIQQDVTKEKIAQEKLIFNEEKYRNIIANINLGLLETDINDKIIFANQSFCNMSGYSMKELIGNIAKELLLDEKNKNIISEKEVLRKNNTSDAYELKINTKQKEEKIWLVSGAPMYDSQGGFMGSIGIHLDITKQKETERNLTLFKNLVDYSGDSIQISEENGKFFYVNEEATKQLGYSALQLQEMYVKDIEKIFQDDESTWQKHVEELKKLKKGLLIEGENIDSKGNHYPVEVKANFVNVGKNGFVVASSRNISERKENEKKLKELVETLKIVNQDLTDFAYVVSHDLKAPLRAIGSLSSWLKSDYSDKLDDEGKNILHLLEQRTHRMHNLIEGVLNYSRIGQTKKEIVLQKTFKIVSNLIDSLSPSENITIHIDKNLPNVYFEDVKFGQIFQNLISNAIKFMDKEHGEIEIGFERKIDQIIFFVKDNGPGIDEKHQHKIFQIFQTLNSRDDFESTGVGLSIVKKIVETGGGKIWLTSKVGEGSTFFFSVMLKEL